jgi:hypothetical protein
MIFFWAFAIAATVVSPPFENKNSAEDVFSQCESLLESWEGEHPIYMSRYLVSGQGYRYRITIDIPTQLNQEQLSQLSDLQCIKIEEIPLSISPGDSNTTVVVKKKSVENGKESREQEDESTSKGFIRRLFSREEEELPTVEELYRLSQTNHQRVYDRWEGRTGQKFTYQRTLFDPMSKEVLVVEQTYYQKDEKIRLDVHVKKGNGVNSISVLGKDGASWLITSDGRRQIDQEKLTELLKRFSFENLYSTVLYFPKNVEEDGYWRMLEDVDVDDEYWILRPVQDDCIVRQAEFYMDANLLASVIIEQDGELEYRYLEYKDVDGWIPYVIQVFHSGFKIEEIVIKDLQFNVDLEESFFDSEQLSLDK